MAARNALLRYLRVSVNPSPALPSSSVLLRRFSEEVRGSFLDKSDVTDRVISVVKNFQRVDPSKEEFGFEIPDNDADKIQSVDLAVDFIASHPQATKSFPCKKVQLIDINLEHKGVEGGPSTAVCENVDGYARGKMVPQHCLN
ncbi:hypothetical protein F2Q70_00044913 [Brassica cretica]|uniref:Acyl carrier protein n=1 Tax=Brassica cretica TaxID=69181 RepID=A0A8S9KMK7_BRACR|nr:hypothetical protein F2Q70_00044913 [Brassica cretica]